MSSDHACLRGRVHSLRLFAGCISALCLTIPTIAVTQQITPTTDSATAGSGLSYWGPIPPAGDSTIGLLTNRPLATWEAVLIWPYRVVAFPFRLLADGIGSTVELVDETPSLARLFSLRPRAVRLTPELNVGGLSGLGAGITIQHDSATGPGHQLRLRVYGSTQGDKRLTIGFRRPLADRASGVVGAGFRDHANTRFYGIGPGSTAADESLFREVQWWVGAEYRRGLGTNLALTASALFSSDETGEPAGDFAPSITDVFAGNLPPGFDATSNGLSATVTIERDDTPGDARPSRGGRQLAKVLYFHSTNDAWASHWSFRADVQQFFKLWFPHTVLAFRGVLAWHLPVGDAPIPFQRLVHNNDPDLLRGFPDRRWRDRGLVLVSAEYRWPIWVYNRAEGAGIDGYFLTDIGQVFPDLSAIRHEELTVSFGGGIRLLSANGFVLRLEYAHSAEGGLWRLQSQQVFQFTRGLFHGRDAVPVR